MSSKILILLILLIFVPCVFVMGQEQSTTVFDTSGFPQWAKDLRRFEIVAFGTYPFTMFASMFAMDMYRWIEQGMDWTDSGRRYAPWPLKSPGPVDMTNKQYEMTMVIAAGVSVTLAVIDLIIVQIKRSRMRERAESLPAGTTIIIRQPWPPENEEGQNVPDVDIEE